MTVVCPVGSAIAIVCSGENKDVVTATERILVEHNWTKYDIRVVARSLVSGRTIEVPVG